MSNLLEEAIVDAKALKEAAMKNAQAAIVEKYSDEVKQAVDSLLNEQDPMNDPVSPSPSSDVVNSIPVGALDGEVADKEMCGCPGDDEEIVTISLSEQKRAKKESKKKKKRKDMLTIEEGTDDRTQGLNPKIGGKRVKFGTTNRSKSYKASMKALVTSNVPNTSESTPEKGILLNKGKIRQAGVTKRGGRKKAINYF